ncbi:prolipoprotein diacylglyceryl transferase [Microvirga sp. STR05]|uniref:Phosphatidylglycerol--prolipoprotein diacylglyceryl transferase n=1 Tax=Hymenobacter duratus TaxID=2771356 RepID=A0ABR8JFX6_9BACT|nr:prolipoprotein diacylglyceryl transferase [Hymenobacter duratus]MBD2715778.1 prolipoprotein diacylglyceryl transferase [Hymenobacter duratus]MBR7950689.1 prolipoprotein diacylglyceryl transferase [Microvirga sp. STR05]
MLSFLSYITWNTNPILAEIGPLTLRWYGLLFMSGFVFGTFILSHIYKSERVSPRWVDVITIYMLVGTILGARLGHVLFYDPAYYLTSEHFWEIFKIWEGGLASHGATLGILLATYLFARNNKFDYLWVLDRIVIVVALGGAMIRLGNLMNSEIVGEPTDKPWAFVFVRDAEHLKPAVQPLPAGAVQVAAEPIMRTDGSRAYRLLPAGTPVAADSPMAVPRHPTQIYEAAFCILLLVVLYGMWNRTKDRTPRGLLFGLFVVLLFTQRFLGEFLKENQEAFEDKLPLNMGQILSLPLILVGLWVLWRAGKDPKNPYGYAPRDLEEQEAKDKKTIKA